MQENLDKQMIIKAHKNYIPYMGMYYPLLFLLILLWWKLKAKQDNIIFQTAKLKNVTFSQLIF